MGPMQRGAHHMKNPSGAIRRAQEELLSEGYDMNPFTKGAESYKSDIILGEQYREKSTGLVGKAVAIAFFEHACERVTLRYLHDGDIKEAGFDAPEVESVKTQKTPVQQKSGGPERNDGRRGVISR